MSAATLSTWLKDAVEGGGRVSVLTGAGISAESGLRTFRDNDGLWEEHRVEDVATPEAFARDPDLVYRFYNMRRAQLAEVKPNPAHHALAGLERALGDRFFLITQNVDDLHERAGSERVFHMHGELRKFRCQRCGETGVTDEAFDATSRCACGGGLRPHIVWFGEMPFGMASEIPDALNCTVFLAVGTSGVVYPAAGLVHHASTLGSRTALLNLESADNASAFELYVAGKCGETLPAIVGEALSSPS